MHRGNRAWARAVRSPALGIGGKLQRGGSGGMCEESISRQESQIIQNAAEIETLRCPLDVVAL